MALANLNDLLASVASWANRSDLGSVINDCVTLGESSINRGFFFGGEYIPGLRLMEQDETATLSISTNSVSLPADYLELISLAYTDDYGIDPVTKAHIDVARAASVPGRPELYCVGSGSILFERTPDQTYTATLRYFSKWDLVSDSTNWLLTNRPNVYLSAVLSEVFRWLGDDDRAAQYAGALASQMKALAIASSRSEASPTLKVDPALASAGIFDINTGE